MRFQLPYDGTGRLVPHWWQERIKAIEQCPEHSWVMHLEQPEDDPFIDVFCVSCSADFGEVYPDLLDLIFLEVEGITVRNGGHDSARYAEIHVTIKVTSLQDYLGDWDVEVLTEASGPVVWLDGE